MNLLRLDQKNRIAIVTLGLSLTPGCGGIISPDLAAESCTVSNSLNVVSWWDASSVSGSTARDRVSTGNSATLSGVNISTNGKFGSAFSFDGSGSTFSIDSTANLSPSTELTVSGWVNSSYNTATSNVMQSLISKWNIQPASSMNVKENWQGLKFDASSIFSGNAQDGTPWSSFGSTTDFIFDGRYLYSLGGTGRIARFDTTGTFTSISSWEGVDVSAFAGTYDGSNSWSQLTWLNGAAFDGRYIYFPNYTTTGNGVVGRYDTRKSFTTSAGWQAVKVSAFAGNAQDGTAWTNFREWWGAVYDGRYVYLVPNRGANYPGTPTLGTLARYDTQNSNFTSSVSWEGVNLSGLAGNAQDGTSWSNFQGMKAGVFDGRYVYFGKWFGSIGSNQAIVARFDTVANTNFSNATGWQGVNLSNFAGNAQDGVAWSSTNRMAKGTFDGRYVYLGTKIRFDIQGSFLSSSAGWQSVTYNNFTGNILSGAAWSSISNLDHGGPFDGRYVYHAVTGGLARYDTQLPHYSKSSWDGVQVSTFPGTMDGVTSWSSYTGAAVSSFDGRYVYIADYGAKYIIRYDTIGTSGSYSLRYSDGSATNGMGTSFVLNTNNGIFRVNYPSPITAGSWHHVAVTYNGSLLTLYLDGTQVAQQPASGTIASNTAPVQVGTLLGTTGAQGALKGLVDNVQIFSKALTSSQIADLYQDTPSIQSSICY